MPAASLHEACRRGDVDAVRALLTADPSAVDADDEHAWRPIFHAALGRHEAVVRLIIEAGADLAAHDGYVMHDAGEVPDNKAIVILADAERVRSLIGPHHRLVTTPDGRGDHPIHHAARNGDTEVVQLLLQNGAGVNATNPRGHTVLYSAGGHGHLDALQLLLNTGADHAAQLKRDSKTLLEWLAQYPDDPRYAPLAAALRRHTARS